MTYFGFLAVFLGIPIAILAVLTYLDSRRGRAAPPALRSWPLWAAVAINIGLALIWTTPWDNYLVATQVWSYDPKLVTGIVFGWVPIEEYTFFVVQPILASLWLHFLLRRWRFRTWPAHAGWRFWPLLPLGIVWLVSAGLLLSGWPPSTYLALELVWALPPIMLQLAFGGDILAKYGRVVLVNIATVTLYLSAADWFAIGSGTWTINPEKSFPFFLAGWLPIEEFIFFLLTNTLVTLGVLLLLSADAHARLRRMLPAAAQPAAGSQE